MMSRFLSTTAVVLLLTAVSTTSVTGTRLMPLRQPLQPAPAASGPLAGLVPNGTLTHFGVITQWDLYDTVVASWTTLLGQGPPPPNIAGGLEANGTVIVNGTAQPLEALTKLAFVHLNNGTMMEFNANSPDKPNWGQMVYEKHGYIVMHMGFALPVGVSIWPVVQKIRDAGLGKPVQWARWGTINQPGSGCYVLIDTFDTLGTTTEVLGQSEGECDSLPAQPPSL